MGLNDFTTTDVEQEEEDQEDDIAVPFAGVQNNIRDRMHIHGIRGTIDDDSIVHIELEHMAKLFVLMSMDYKEAELDKLMQNDNNG